MSQYKPHTHQMFSLVLRGLLREGELSQREFAKRANLDIGYVSKLVNGKIAEPRQSQYRQIAEGLGITEAHLRELVYQGDNTVIPDKSGHIVEEDSQNIELCAEDNIDWGFLGREGAIADLDEIVQQGYRAIVIHAAGGQGKTTFARRYLEKRTERYLDFSIAKRRQDIPVLENLLAERLFELGIDSGRELWMLLDRLKQVLKTQLIGVLLDNIETALDESGQFVPEHKAYLELIRVLADPSLKSIALITSRELLCESVEIEPYHLPSLSLATWKLYFEHREIEVDEAYLSAVHSAFGGNALAMKVLCAPIRRFFEGNLAAYWEANKTPDGVVVEAAVRNLVREQFNRLQETYPDAYQLLCRMGCYRYQLQAIPLLGVQALLWDVAECDRSKIINALRDRDLVDLHQNHYSLHSVIQTEASLALRKREDYQKTHRSAAEFWLGKVKTLDCVKGALEVLEAFRHYYEIENFESAFAVFDRSIDRDSNHRVEHKLRYFGCSQQMLDWLRKLEGKLSPDLEIERLRYIAFCLYYLAEYPQAIEQFQAVRLSEISALRSAEMLCWMAHSERQLGRFECAIAQADEALACLSGLDSEDLRLLAVLQCETRNVLGMAYRARANYERSMNYHIQALKLSRKNCCPREEADALAGLAICKAETGEVKKAIQLHSEALQIFQTTDEVSENFARCYLSRLYTEQGEFDLARSIVQKVIEMPPELTKPSLKSLLWRTLALLEWKASGQLECAEDLYRQAITMNRSLSTRFSLANTYAELARFYRETEREKEAIDALKQANQLFREIGTPKRTL